MNTLVLGNPLGLWALLGIPAVVAIHFLQPKSRRVLATTMFLLEHLPPLATTGRAWRWIRSTWALWLQLLAVLLLTWLLAEPRWQRPDSLQTIVLVLDASASMRAFQDDAAAALRDRAPEWERAAARTEWILRETSLARPVLYRGFDRAAALAALDRWQPDLPGHDFAPALEVARQLVRRNGAAVLVTDRAPDLKLETVALLAVGRPVENVGFAGGSVAPAASGARPRWTILVHHRGSVPAQRTLTIAARATPTAGATPAAGTSDVVRREELALGAGELLTLAGEFPAGVEALEFRLTPDAFDLDDTLPLVVPVPRPLTWRIQAPERTAAFFRRVFERTPGLTPAVGSTTPDIMVFSTRTLFNHPLAGAGLMEIMLYAADTPGTRVATAPVIAENHGWADGLTWSGLLGPGPQAEFLPPEGRALLWQGEKPLAWHEQPQGVPRLVVAWDWAASNAERLPASAVLLHRLIEDARARKFAPATANLDAGQPIALPPEPPAVADHTASTAIAARWTWRIGDGAPQEIDPTGLAALRAPTMPGLLELRRNDALILRAATQFADPREADFAAAVTHTEPEQLALDAMQANSERDHLRPLWLLLLAGVLVASWAVQAPKAPWQVAGAR